jgi:twinkle protein
MRFDWSKWGIDTSKLSGGKGFCPKCHSDRKHRRDRSLSVDLQTGLFNCHNPGCNYKGCAVAYEKLKKEYVAPVPRLEKLGQKLLHWFEKERGISNNTLLRLNITESMEWMPQFPDKDKVPAICFNYYRGETLVNIKFRGPQKSFKMSKDAELIFYNINSILGEKEANIVEGENDALTLHECGIYNVVSVPNGANVKGDMKLEYLDNCWQDFEDKEKIILWTDNDTAGNALKEELARRFGKERVWVVHFPAGYKDPNEVLVGRKEEKEEGTGIVVKPGLPALGKDEIKRMHVSATQWPLEGVMTMDEMYPTIAEWYENGYPPGARTRIPGLDKHLTFAPGSITTVTGIPSHGKDEFSNWIMASLAKYEKWSFGVCGFEETPPETATKIMEKLVGKAFEYRIEPAHRITVAELEEAIVLFEQLFFLINPDEAETTIDGLIEKAIELVKRKGIKGFYLSPWNCIDHQRPPGMSETEYVSQVYTKLIKFARRYGVHVFLIAHPTKIQKNKDTEKYEVPTLYSISGCHDEQTEVLTNRGWIRHKNISLDDLVACFDLEKESISYQKPTDYINFPFAGDMCHFKGSSIDILVTGNHRMVLREGRYKTRGWQFIEAAEVPKSPLLLPKAFDFSHANALGSVMNLDDGYCMNMFFGLIGWYISEGCIMSGSVTNYKEKHPELVKFLIANCGVGSDIKLPDMAWLASKEQKEILLMNLIQGDGSFSKGSYKYFTCSRQLADDVSRLSYELGYKVTQSFSKSRKPGWKDQYVVYISNRSQEWLMPANHQKLYYEGFVYCLTVPTGAYVTRRNGRVAITGNSANFFNKTYNGMTIYRDEDIVDVHIQKVKQSWLGKTGCISYRYSTLTRQYSYLPQKSDI